MSYFTRHFGSPEKSAKLILLQTARAEWIYSVLKILFKFMFSKKA